MKWDHDFDRALPPSDRQEQPDTSSETPSERIKRICRERGWTIQEGPIRGRGRAKQVLHGNARTDAIMAGRDPDQREPGDDTE